jgi:hypothetical protein
VTVTGNAADRRAEGGTAIVVGGGVSGCACAARLAGHGISVTVISSALDVVGLPGYGPTVEAGPAGWPQLVDVFECLPEALRRSWLGTAVVPVSGEPALVIDRRAVSVETKRALETIPGLQFRQALITDARVLPDGRVEVESAFGEVFAADVVVIASGLALQGRVEVGEEVLAGGRYGEVPANELHGSLSALGMSFVETAVEVGPRYAHDSLEILAVSGSPSGTVGGEEAGQVNAACVNEAGEMVVWRALAPWVDTEEGRIAAPADHRWPDGFPPAPYWSGELRPAGAVLRICGGRDRGCGPGGADQGATGRGREGQKSGKCQALGVVVPDGVSTAEYYVSPTEADVSTVARLPGIAGDGLTRLGHRVKALVVAEADVAGRVRGVTSRLRLAGRAAGADTYLASLRSGVLVADSVAAELRPKGDRE